MTDEQILAAVLAAGVKTVVFDFDGTVWPGDAGTGFMHWTVKTGLLAAEKADWVTGRHRAYHRGEVGESTMCGEMVQVYAGLTREAVRASAREYFAAEVAPHLFPVMVELIGGLKRRGAEIWAVSSTNGWVIEEGVRALGIAPDRVLAACVAVSEDGMVTDRLLDIPSDEGKAEALRRVGLPRPDAVFGNSVHDAAMLEMARMPFAVNPNAGLRKIAAERGWAMYFPAAMEGWEG